MAYYSGAVQCDAWDAKGNFAFCFTSDPTMVAIARSLNSASYIDFGWDAKSNCTHIDVQSASFYIH
jgi:hypothetical protein